MLKYNKLSNNHLDTNRLQSDSLQTSQQTDIKVIHKLDKTPIVNFIQMVVDITKTCIIN